MGAFSLIVVINLLNREVGVFRPMTSLDIQLSLDESFLSYLNPCVLYSFPITTDVPSVKPDASSSSQFCSIGCLYLNISQESQVKVDPLKTLKLNSVKNGNRLSSNQIAAISRKRNNNSHFSNDPCVAKQCAVVAPYEKNCQTSSGTVDLPENSFAECNLNGERLFLCAFCSCRMKQKGEIKRHIATIHSENPREYVCSTCNWKTKEKYKLKLHYVKDHKLPEVAAKSAADAA